MKTVAILSVFQSFQSQHYKSSSELDLRLFFFFKVIFMYYVGTTLKSHSVPFLDSLYITLFCIIRGILDHKNADLLKLDRM